MYNRVVIPLDGSKLAEVAIPHLEEIVKGCNIKEILLVSVTEEVKGRVSKSMLEPSEGSPYSDISSDQILDVAGVVFSTTFPKEMPVVMGKMAKTAANYLRKIADLLEKRGFNVKATVLVGKPGEEIIRFVDEQDADLVVIASRGKSGISRWEMGNVADKVIRGANIPVMLVKPGANFKETKSRRRGQPM